MKTLPFITILVVSLSMCRNTQEAATPPSSELPKQTTTEKVDDQTYRFSVSFISIGSGKDWTALKKFREFLREYNSDRSVPLTYTESSWGREGELDYCFPLTELDEDQQLEFIERVMNELRDSKLVRYNENATCRGTR